MSNTQTKGVYFAVITAFVSGIAIFVNKFAVGAMQPPLIFTATKNAGVGILIVSLLFAGKKWRLIKKLNRKEMIYLTLIGVVGGSIPFYLFFTGISQTSAVNAALIHKTLVFWVALFAVPFLGEKLSLDEAFAVLLLFAGNLMIGGFEGFKFSTGELMILAATILWGVENVLAKKVLSTVDPDVVTFARMGLGSIILLASAAVVAPDKLLGVTTMSTMQWFWMIATATTLLTYISVWYRALKYAPAITVSSILVASTLVTNVLSAIFITHAWTAVMGLQSLVILVGVGIFWFVARREASKANHVKISVETKD